MPGLSAWAQRNPAHLGDGREGLVARALEGRQALGRQDLAERLDRLDARAGALGAQPVRQVLDQARRRVHAQRQPQDLPVLRADAVLGRPTLLPSALLSILLNLWELEGSRLEALVTLQTP